MSLKRPPAEWLSQEAGQKFVLIHGLAMAPAFWRLYAPRHVLDNRTVAYPLPGHFPWQLENGGAELTTEEIVEAYAAAIERDFDGRRVTLVGHSTGAFVSLLIAAQRPDLVQSVVLMGGFACGRFEGHERLAARLLRMPLVGRPLFISIFRRWIASPEQFRTGSSDCVYDKTCPWETPETLDMMETVREHLLQSRPEEIGAIVGWIQSSSHLSLLGNIDVPVLNLIGIHDGVVPPLHQLRLSRLLPNVQTVLFGEAGHLLMVECSAQMNEVFSRFVRNPLLAMPLRRPQQAEAAQQQVSAALRPAPARALRPSLLQRAAALMGSIWLFGTNPPEAHF